MPERRQDAEERREPGEQRLDVVLLGLLPEQRLQLVDLVRVGRPTGRWPGRSRRAGSTARPGPRRGSRRPGANVFSISGSSRHGTRGIRIDSHQPSLYIARLPKFSKYCWVCRSGASASASESANVTPVIGCCSTPSTWVGCGIPAMSRMVGPMSVTWVNCDRRPPASVMRSRPADDQRVAGAAEVRGDLLAPLERGVAGPRPRRGVVRVHHLGAPRLQPAPLQGELHLLLVGEREPVDHRALVERAGRRALEAGAVVAPDPDHDGVVELAHLLDRVEQPADVVVGVLRVAGVDLHLVREQPLAVLRQRVPGRHQLVARRQLGVRRAPRRAPSGGRTSPRAARPSPGRTGPCTCPTTPWPRGAGRGCSRSSSRASTACPSRGRARRAASRSPGRSSPRGSRSPCRPCPPGRR